ncbi:MAG: hypothetical protein GF353_28755 [Candidatus Lokiarchaeota archaeon]|nr:hypothetical protein [Candidatus Lokiarchaeota archaeon]MBD3353993.1 hypothetical protein [Candidatus Lokiarchaeota archaeon]
MGIFISLMYKQQSEQNYDECNYLELFKFSCYPNTLASRLHMNEEREYYGGFTYVFKDWLKDVKELFKKDHPSVHAFLSYKQNKDYWIEMCENDLAQVEKAIEFMQKHAGYDYIITMG